MAAASMQDVKRRIKSVTSTEHITNAMKLVSAGKLRKAKSVFDRTNENSHYITNTIGELFNSNREVPQEYLEGSREIKKTAYVIISSSKGLCGGYNSNIIKEAERLIGQEEEPPMIVAIGSKVKEYFEKRNYKIYSSYMDPPEGITFRQSAILADPLIEMYRKEEIDRIVLIYTSFITTLSQEVRSETLLPFKVEKNPELDSTERFIEYEPSVEAVFNYLVPKYVETMIYASIVEAATCEHAARRMAMENATDAARDMMDSLSLMYNRARQSAITDEIIEIVAGSEATN